MNKNKLLKNCIVIFLIFAISTPSIIYADISNNKPNHGESGNFFDDYINSDKDNDNKIDESSDNYTDNLGLAAGIQQKTDIYSYVALTIAAIAFTASISFFIMYAKRNKNHY